MRYIKHIYILAIAFLITNTIARAQTETAQGKLLLLNGQVYNNGSPIDSAEITVYKGNTVISKYFSAKKGKFKVNLPLNDKFQLKISYRRCYDKKIEIITTINDGGIKVNWAFEFNVDMVEFFPDVKNIESMQQPIARIVYFGKQFGFDYDDEYTLPAQANMQKEVKEEIAKTTPEERREYLEKLSNNDNNAEAIAAAKAQEANMLAKAAEDAKQRAAFEKIRKDNELKAAEEANRAKNDSTLKSSAANAKFKRDAELKAMMDAAKAKRDAEARAKQVRDSVARAEFAKKDVKVAPPKIDDAIDDYPDGVTEETIEEKNRTIKRTIVNSDNTKAVYQQITYTYGAIFYFKNDKSLTKDAFETDLAKAKKAADKE